MLHSLDDDYLAELDRLCLTFWSSCTPIVVYLLNRLGLVVEVIPEIFDLYEIISRRHVSHITKELLNNKKLKLMSVEILNGGRFKRLHQIVHENAAEMVVDM